MEAHASDGVPSGPDDALAIAQSVIEEVSRAFASAAALLRAELRLARSSAVALVWLAFAAVMLGLVAWLAANAAIATGLYALTGSLAAGIGAVALANGIALVLVLRAMRTCWNDLGLPRTRKAIASFGEEMH